jgi:hypothetical protein
MTTPNLALPELVASQAQKEVTHNEALAIIDALLCGGVVNRTQTAEPTSPANGDCYIVAATATGPFTGHENHLAHYYSGSWRFYIPKEGWHVRVKDEDIRVEWNGTAWDDTATFGPRTDTFSQCLKIRRNNAVVGSIDNNASGIRVKATANGNAALVNDSNNGLTITEAGGASFDLPVICNGYTVATLPSASSFTRGMIYVSDESGGATLAFSDGSNWRRVSDLAIVS